MEIRKRKIRSDKKYYDDYLIIKLYTEKYSGVEISKKIGCSVDAIYSILKNNNIKRRSSKDCKILCYKKKYGYDYSKITKELLIDLYYKQNLGISDIAKKLNGCSYTIRKLMNIYNIKIKDRVGSRNTNWKGGNFIDKNSGRKLIYKPNHGRGMYKNHVYEYVLVAENKLGRKLFKNEIVHHIDNDVANNNSENLLVMTQSEHIKLHKNQGDMKRCYKKKIQ